MTTKQQAESANVEPSSRRRGLRVTIVVALLLVVLVLAGLLAARIIVGPTSQHPCATHGPATAGVPLCRR